MPTVTGNIIDIGGSAMAGKHIEVSFMLDRPNASSSGLYPTEPEVVTPSATGDFSVTLAETTNMVDASGYRMRWRWISSDSNTTVLDFPDWLIVVPASGGQVHKLITVPNDIPGGRSGRFVYVSLTAPPDARPWSLWLQSDPDDPDNSKYQSSGNLYELRNI